MASRDKSQNVGFVYTNIYQLYKKSQNAPSAPGAAAAQALTSDSRVWRASDLNEIKITKFQPRDLRAPAAAPAAPALADPASPVVIGSPFDDLKANLSKLQDLHSKLRFMLKELEDLVEKK